MAKYHIDRMKKKYNWSGGRYEDLLNKVIAHNTNELQKGVAKISQEEMQKTIDRSKKLKTKQIHIPDWSDVMPNEKAHFIKSAEKGKLMSATLREELGKKLRETLKRDDLHAVRGRGAGKLNEKMIKEFSKTVREVFDNYTRGKGIPSQVETIARTEIRSATNNMKRLYMESLQKNNMNISVMKKWRHNGNPKKPRKGHVRVSRWVPIGINSKFKVLNDQTGAYDYMMAPHDPSAPASQNIGCNCDIVYTILG